MSPATRVLIVDPSAESREVLRTALQRLGAETLETERPEQAVALTGDSTPDLILFDADSDQSAGNAASRDLQAAADRNGSPIVVLGAISQESAWADGGECVAKPYHYAPLVRKIEGLLASRRAA